MGNKTSKKELNKNKTDEKVKEERIETENVDHNLWKLVGNGSK